MPQVNAWQCPRTGILFATKAAYLTHLESLALKSRDEKARIKFMRERDEAWAEFRNSLTDISQLQDHIINNQDMFWKDLETVGRIQDCAIAKGKGKRIPRLSSFPKFNINYQRDTRATHGAPLGHKPCWSSKDVDEHNKQSYPGYYGQFEVKFDDPDRADVGYSDFFGTYRGHPGGIHTGSGSGHANHKDHTYRWQGEIYLFIKDFPQLHAKWLIDEEKRIAEEYEREKVRMWNILNKA